MTQFTDRQGEYRGVLLGTYGGPTYSLACGDAMALVNADR